MIFSALRLIFWRASTYRRLVKTAGLVLYIVALLLFFGLLVNKPDVPSESPSRRPLPTADLPRNGTHLPPQTAPKTVDLSPTKRVAPDNPTALRNQRID
ncbi:MAG: hypothetical protein N3A66_02890 [Planctomycetota bacterium]|nr:hypothetical protein [Planctomycetota bacterium]